MRNVTVLLIVLFAGNLAGAPRGDATPWVVKALQAEAFYDAGFERELTDDEKVQLQTVAKSAPEMKQRLRAQFALLRLSGLVFQDPRDGVKPGTLVTDAVAASMRRAEAKLDDAIVKELITHGMVWVRVSPVFSKQGHVEVSLEHHRVEAVKGAKALNPLTIPIHGAVKITYDSQSRTTVGDLQKWGTFKYE